MFLVSQGKSGMSNLSQLPLHRSLCQRTMVPPLYKPGFCFFKTSNFTIRYILLLCELLTEFFWNIATHQTDYPVTPCQIMTQETRSSKKLSGPILFCLRWYICDDVNHCGTNLPGSITIWPEMDPNYFLIINTNYKASPSTPIAQVIHNPCNTKPTNLPDSHSNTRLFISCRRHHVLTNVH